MTWKSFMHLFIHPSIHYILIECLPSGRYCAQQLVKSGAETDTVPALLLGRQNKQASRAYVITVHGYVVMSVTGQSHDFKWWPLVCHEAVAWAVILLVLGGGSENMEERLALLNHAAGVEALSPLPGHTAGVWVALPSHPCLLGM